jgi:PAS domain S-box-containing protein
MSDHPMPPVESRYQQLVSQLRQGLFVSRPDGTIVEANDVIAQMAGYSSAAEFLQVPAHKFYVDPKDRDLLMEELVRTGRVRNRALHAVKKDGTHCWASFSAILEKTPDGEPKAIVGMVTDVGEPQSGIQERLTSEGLYRRIIETFPYAIAVTGLDGAFITANEQLAKLFGYRDVRELYDMQVISNNLVDEADHPKMAASTQAMLGEDAVVRGLEARAHRKDGTMFLAEFSARLLRDFRGEPEVFLTLVRDVTEQAQTKQALIASEALLKEAQSISHIGHYDLDIANNRLETSEELDNILGITKSYPHTIEGFSALMHPDGPAAPAVAELKEPPGSFGSFDRICRIIRHATHELRWVRDRGNWGFDNNGKPVRLFGTISDVTEAKQAEEAHERLEEKLRQSQKLEAIGLLAGGVAHDLNNMLTPILGNADLLLFDLNLDPTQQKSLRDIVGAAQRAQDLVRQLMAFGRKQTLRMQVLELDDLLSRTTYQLRSTIRKSIKIEIELSSRASHVRADRQQLEQVIKELAENAEEAMPDGGQLTIRTQDSANLHGVLQVPPDLGPGRYVIVTLRDSGSGMDAQTKQRIFEPFFTTKKTSRTTGLGLASVYGIIRQHGGDIQFDSEVGNGTEFRIFLPCSPINTHSDSMVPSGPLELAQGNEMILVAEDEAEVRKMTCSLLSHLGYNVLSAGTISEILQIARSKKEHIKLLLTDVVMPEMTGMELSRQIKKDLPSLKVMFMSGYAKEVIGKDEIVDKAHLFIQKPFTVQALSMKVRQALDS